MLLRRTADYGKPVRIVRPGEVLVSAADEILGTLLGACVAVYLYDPGRGVGGLNHFVLASRSNSVDRAHPEAGRFGPEAMDLLKQKVLGAGAQTGALQAMIFGGTHNSRRMHVAENVRIARILLEIEDIPIIREDVGAQYYRKVLVEVATGRVYIHRIEHPADSKGAENEAD